MRIKQLLFIALMVSLAQAQDTRPKLELEPRLNLNGGGFQTVSGSMTGGVGFEGLHYIWHLSGTYDAAKKVEYTDLKDNTNPHGNIESLQGRVWYETDGGWLFGCSGSYARLRTTLYRKEAFGSACGAGYDFFNVTCPNCSGNPTSVRFTAEYGLPVNHGPDEEHGFTFNFWVPSPAASDRRFFFHVLANAGWVSGHGHDGGAGFGVLMRF